MKVNDIIRELTYSEDDKIEELGYQLEDAIDSIKKNAILDIADFKRELERAKLMTPKLEEFIENYMRWDNHWKY